MNVKERRFLICALAALLLLLVSAANATPARAEEAGSEGNQETQENQNRELVVDLTKGYIEWSGSSAEDYRHRENVFHSLYGLENCPRVYSVGLSAFDLGSDGIADFFFGGYGWPDEEGMASVVFVIPSADSNIHGSVTYSVEKMKADYTGYDRVTFLFPEESFQKEYTVSVEKGHIEVDGKTVTSVAPGTLVSIVPDELDGEFVASWKNSLIGAFSRYGSYENCWMTSAAFYMPASDISLSANTKKQVPLTIDMQKGYCLAAETTWDEPNLGDFRLALRNLWEKSGNRVDLNNDGTYDVYCYVVTHLDIFGSVKDEDMPYRTYFIPLSTSSISGSYKTYGTSISAYWPITFVFPQQRVENLYPVSIEGGHVEDEQGRTITQAAPGEKIKIVYDGVHAATGGLVSSPEYEKLIKKSTWNGERYQSLLRQDIVMPACPLTYKPLPNEGKRLELSFYYKENPECWSAVITEDVENLFKKNNNSFRSALCWYLNFNPKVAGGSVQMDYVQNYQLYYGLEYTLPEPLITDEEIYTSVRVEFGPTVLYPITCTDEGLEVYWPYHQCEETKGSLILASEGNRYLGVDKKKMIEPEGYQFSGFEAKDFRMDYNAGEDTWYFTIPYYAIELKPVFTKVDTAKQTPITIDLSQGSFNATDEEILKSLAKTGVSYDSSLQKYDLNGDGKWDVHVNAGLQLIRILDDYSCGESFTIETGNHGQKYFPITFVYKPKENNQAEVTPTVTPAQNEGDAAANETTPSGTPSSEAKKKGGKDGVLLVVLAVLAVLLLAGGAVFYCILRNRKEEERKEMRRERIAEMRRQRAREERKPKEDFSVEELLEEQPEEDLPEELLEEDLPEKKAFDDEDDYV